jgi:hypothetical protein
MSLLSWVFVCFGITTIITLSKLFEPLRQRVKERSNFFGEMIVCNLCMSFWVGFIVSLCYYSPTNNMFFDACLASGSCWLLYCITWFTALRYGA